MVQWLRLYALNAGGLGSIPGQGTRFHKPQLIVHMPQLRPSTAKLINLKKIFLKMLVLLVNYYLPLRRLNN